MPNGTSVYSKISLGQNGPLQNFPPNFLDTFRYFARTSLELRSRARISKVCTEKGYSRLMLAFEFLCEIRLFQNIRCEYRHPKRYEKRTLRGVLSLGYSNTVAPYPSETEIGNCANIRISISRVLAVRRIRLFDRFRARERIRDSRVESSGRFGYIRNIR